MPANKPILIVTGLATVAASMASWVYFSGFSWPPPGDPYDRVRYTDEVQVFLKRYPDADIDRTPPSCYEEDVCPPYATVGLKYWSPDPVGTAWLTARIPHSGYDSPTFTAWCNRGDDTLSPIMVSGERINMSSFLTDANCPPYTLKR